MGDQRAEISQILASNRYQCLINERICGGNSEIDAAMVQQVLRRFVENPKDALNNRALQEIERAYN